MSEIPDYEPPKGGEWVIPSVEPYDCEPGVSDPSLLNLLDAPAKRLMDRIRAGGHIDSGIPSRPDGVGSTENIERIGSRLAELLSQLKG